MREATDIPSVTGEEIDRLTEHIMSLDLDAETLEMLMAALTVEACDHTDLPAD